MRLTNGCRTAFINAVLDDVPFIDYQEKARLKLQNKAIDLLPPPIRGLHNAFRNWFKTVTLHRLPAPLNNVYVVGFDAETVLSQMKADTTFWKSIEDLAEAHAAQYEQRRALRETLRSCISSCTTVQQAQVLMPELAKYLPTEKAPPSRAVPVVQSPISLLTAAGWPKQPA